MSIVKTLRSGRDSGRTRRYVPSLAPAPTTRFPAESRTEESAKNSRDKSTLTGNGRSPIRQNTSTNRGSAGSTNAVRLHSAWREAAEEAHPPSRSKAMLASFATVKKSENITPAPVSVMPSKKLAIGSVNSSLHDKEN